MTQPEIERAERSIAALEAVAENLATLTGAVQALAVTVEALPARLLNQSRRHPLFVTGR